MGRLGHIIRNPQPGGRRQLALVLVSGVRIPDLDNVEGPLGRQGNSLKRFLSLLKQTIRNTLDHGIDEDCVGLCRINLFRPGSAPLILGNIPQGTDTLLHEEEHTALPGIS
jgi:hypothetical protein